MSALFKQTMKNGIPAFFQHAGVKALAPCSQHQVRAHDAGEPSMARTDVLSVSGYPQINSGGEYAKYIK